MKTAAALLCSLLALSAAEDEPEPLPSPTGPQAIGRMTVHWVDAAREEPETKDEEDKRETLVHLFYPAATAEGKRAPYAPDADVARGPWKPDQVARMQRVQTHCVEDAAPAPGAERFPVALFSPGGGMRVLTYHALLEDLASHGWVVAAIDPSYNAAAMRLPDGRVLHKPRPNDSGWPMPQGPDDEKQNYIARVAHWCRDMSFVIDRLAELDGGEGPLAGRLDLARGVGAVGHSRGGQAAAAVRLIDPRVRGGINLDGTTPYAVLPITGEEISGNQPFLWIQKQLPPPPTDAQLKRAGRTRADHDAEVDKILTGWKTSLGAIRDGACWININRPHVTHVDFSDEPFWDGSMTEKSRSRCLQVIAETRVWVRAFLDGAVRGDWDDLEAQVSAPPADVEVQTFGAWRR